MTSCRRPSATLPTSPKAPGKPRRAFVDSTFALDKITQRFVLILEFRRVPQHRDHLLRVRSSTFAKSDVQGMTLPKGSGCLTEEYPRRRNA